MAGLADIHGSLLRMDMHGLRELKTFFDRYPREARHATAQLLNDIAFAGRPVIVDVLRRHTIVRNPKFALSRTRVEKTPARDLALQSATLGTVYTQGKNGPSHDGWASLQRGQAATRDRVLTLAARGGSEQKQAQRGARMLAGTDFPNPDDADDLPDPTPQRRLQYLLKTMYGLGERRLVIPKGYGLTPGLYSITLGRYRGYRLPSTGRQAPKLRMLQRFGKSPKPRQVPWMQETVLELRRRLDLGALWRAAMAKTWARMKPPTS